MALPPQGVGIFRPNSTVLSLIFNLSEIFFSLSYFLSFSLVLGVSAENTLKPQKQKIERNKDRKKYNKNKISIDGREIRKVNEPAFA